MWQTVQGQWLSGLSANVMSTEQSCHSFVAADIELHDADLRLQIQHASKQVRPAFC